MGSNAFTAVCVSKLGAQKIGFLLKLTSQSRVLMSSRPEILVQAMFVGFLHPTFSIVLHPFHHFFIISSLCSSKISMDLIPGCRPVPTLALACPRPSRPCPPWPQVKTSVGNPMHPTLGALGFSKKRNGENLLKQSLFGEDVWILGIANCDVFFGQCLLVQWENASESRGFAQSFGGKSS